MPRVVEAAVVPLLRHAVDACWDPHLSLGQSRAVAAHLSELALYGPDGGGSDPNSEIREWAEADALADAVVRRLADAARVLNGPGDPAPKAAAPKAAAPKAAAARRGSLAEAASLMEAVRLYLSIARCDAALGRQPARRPLGGAAAKGSETAPPGGIETQTAAEALRGLALDAVLRRRLVPCLRARLRAGTAPPEALLCVCELLVDATPRAWRQGRPSGLQRNHFVRAPGVDALEALVRALGDASGARDRANALVRRLLSAG
jgi:hypothetical protein